MNSANYTKQIQLGCLKNWITSCRAVWPLAFYGAKSRVVGKTHLTKLWREATPQPSHPYANFSASINLWQMTCGPFDSTYPKLSHRETATFSG